MTTVDRIMARQLFHCTTDDSAEEALEYLRMLNIHAAPVFEPDQRIPVGMIALSDLTGSLHGVKARDRMSSPVISVLGTAPLSQAAETIARTEFHHLVVTDVDGRAIGFVSAIDVIRAQLGWIPTEVPADDKPPAGLDLDWSGDESFTKDGLQAAPAGPGVFVLTRITDEHPPSIIWAETNDDLPRRLNDLLDDPPPRIARILERGRLHFRAASVADAAQRREALRSILAASV
jgi:CBS domain-containing protein